MIETEAPPPLEIVTLEQPTPAPIELPAPKIKVSHFVELGICIGARPDPQEGDRVPDMVAVAVAWKNPRDNYSKHIGSLMVEGRIKKGKVRRMPLRVLRPLLQELRQFENAPIGIEMEAVYVPRVLKLPAGRIERGF